MNREKVQIKVADLLSSGVAKSEVFDRLSGEGASDRVLARAIASYADPRLLHENRSLIKILVGIAYTQMIIGFIVGFAAGAKFSLLAGLIFGGLTVLIAAIFVWGFSRNEVRVYNAYLILTLVQTPHQLGHFSSAPISTAIGLCIGFAVYAYVWYVRSRLFPDFAFISPRKANGTYVFSG